MVYGDNSYMQNNQLQVTTTNNSFHAPPANQNAIVPMKDQTDGIIMN